MKRPKKEKHVVFTSQPEIQALRNEILDFRRNLMDSDGRVPGHFKYPKDIVQRVSHLKRLGLSPAIVAKAIGVSPAGVRNWFKLGRPRISRKPSVKLVRELRVEDSIIQCSRTDPARIILNSGVIIELNIHSMTADLLKLLSGPLSTSIGGVR